MIELSAYAYAYANAEAYLEPAPIEYQASYSRFGSLQGRWVVFKAFLKKVFIFPFALLLKLVKTVLRLILAIWGVLKFLISLGLLQDTKQNLIKRMQSFAKEVADWVILPFAAGICFIRMVLGFVVHPALYFGI